MPLSAASRPIASASLSGERWIYRGYEPP